MLSPFPWKMECHEVPMEKHVVLVTLPPYGMLNPAKVALFHLDIYLPISPASCRLPILDKRTIWTSLVDLSKSFQCTSLATIVVSSFHTELSASSRCNLTVPSLRLFSVSHSYCPRASQVPWLWVPVIIGFALRYTRTWGMGKWMLMEQSLTKGMWTDGSMLTLFITWNHSEMYFKSFPIRSCGIELQSPTMMANL